MEPKLPKKPSALIRVAVSDLEAVERDARYAIDMNANWHESSTDRCTVCLAGAVMAKTIGVGAHLHAVPSKFGYDTSLALIALNSFRCGNVNKALVILGLKAITGFSTRPIPEYRESPAEFKIAMLKLADELEGVKL